MAQAVLGGIVVLTDLNPAAVSLHFLLSSAILALAVTLYVRCAEGDGPPTRLVRREVRVFAVAVVGVTALMLAAGTVVTGTGPLAGSTFVPRAGGGPAYVPRYHLPLEGVTQLHADIGWMLGTLVAAARHQPAAHRGAARPGGSAGCCSAWSACRVSSATASTSAGCQPAWSGCT